MLRSLVSRGALLGVLALAAGTAGAGAFDGVMFEYWAGDGPNKAALIIDWQSGGAPGDFAKAFGFQWRDPGTTGQDMIEAIAAASPRFEFDWYRGPEPNPPYEFDEGGAVLAFRWDEDNNGLFDEPDWDRGGFGAQQWWRHFRSDTGDGENWSVFETPTPATLVLTPDYWDGWSWTGTGTTPENPLVPPVVPIDPYYIPEPATVLLVGLGLVAISRRLRKGLL